MILSCASSKVDWMVSERSYPGQPRVKNVKTIVKFHARVEYADPPSSWFYYCVKDPKARRTRPTRLVPGQG